MPLKTFLIFVNFNKVKIIYYYYYYYSYKSVSVLYGQTPT